ncbi:MAG: hypothetical protein AAGJ35_15755, partial [Myxococcota bacterium]
VRKRVEKDARVHALRQELLEAETHKKPRLREMLEELLAEITLEKQGEVAQEFDQVHSVQRAVEVGSLDKIIAPQNLRQEVIDALLQKR